MKLELKHLSPYLPYGLEFIYTHTNKRGRLRSLYDIEEYENIKLSIDCMDVEHIWMFKPILRPLSYLTKEIEVNGKKFVPIIELARLSNFCIYDNHKIVEKHSFGSADSEASYIFSYNKESISFEIENWNSFEGSSFEFVNNNFELVQKLLEWHFDVFELIEKGLAIDINTLT